MSDKRRRFTPEFQAEAVKLVIDTGRPICGWIAPEKSRLTFNGSTQHCGLRNGESPWSDALECRMQ